jgi:hypothetical protein
LVAGCITAVGAEALSFYPEKLLHHSRTQRLILPFKEDAKYKGKKIRRATHKEITIKLCE